MENEKGRFACQFVKEVEMKKKMLIDDLDRNSTNHHKATSRYLNHSSSNCNGMFNEQILRKFLHPKNVMHVLGELKARMKNTHIVKHYRILQSILLVKLFSTKDLVNFVERNLFELCGCSIHSEIFVFKLIDNAPLVCLVLCYTNRLLLTPIPDTLLKNLI